MGFRPATAFLLLVTAGLALVGCGGGAPLAEAERHLTAGRLERATELLEAHSGTGVEALRARIAERAAVRAAALARIAELERTREGRPPSEVLEDLRALAAGARDPVVREHAEVALSVAYDWASEHHTREGADRALARELGARAPRADAPPAATQLAATQVSEDGIGSAARSELERHIQAKDWRSALALATRWSDGAGVSTPDRDVIDAWRAKALAAATREADELVVRAWRLDAAGDRPAAVALLDAVADRFPGIDEVDSDSPAAGVARALAQLSGFAPDGEALARAEAVSESSGPGGGNGPTQSREPGDSGGTVGSDPTAAPSAAAPGTRPTREPVEVAAVPRDRGSAAGDQAPSAAGVGPAGDARGPGDHGRVGRDGTGGGGVGSGRVGPAGVGAGSVGPGSVGPGGGVRPDPADVAAATADPAAARLAAMADSLVQARTTAERDAVFATLFAATRESGSARELLAGALASRFERVLGRLNRVGSLRRLERIAEQRRALDAARERALALIFDEVRYFYPYNTPHVSAEQAAKYPEVQREVDELVAAVQAIWDDGQRVRIPDVLRAELPELAWLRRRAPLVPDGLVLPEKLPDWLEALPHDLEEVDLRSFAWDAEEARDLARSRAIVARNEALWAKLDAERASGPGVPTAAERQQVRVTNDYRAMMGRRALAWHPALAEAARGHSVYMDTTGHFGHHETTPDRRSPFDRMRLVGYTRGVSENCHMGSADAEGAHRGWLRSSGHHRNLLMAGHREMASAVAGSYWTQNFGLDTGFEQHLDLRGWRD